MVVGGPSVASSLVVRRLLRCHCVDGDGDVCEDTMVVLSVRFWRGARHVVEPSVVSSVLVLSVRHPRAS